jgi:hypothetical protein
MHRGTFSGPLPGHLNVQDSSDVRRAANDSNNDLRSYTSPFTLASSYQLLIECSFCYLNRIERG